MSSTKTLLLAAFAATVATGCYTRPIVVHESAGPAVPVVRREVVVQESAGAAAPAVKPDVVVTEPPPAAQVETPGPAPRTDAAWVPGFWKRTGVRWDWVPGRWETLPRGYNTYVPGHWEQRAGGWVYYQGYWR